MAGTRHGHHFGAGMQLIGTGVVHALAATADEANSVDGFITDGHRAPIGWLLGG